MAKLNTLPNGALGGLIGTLAGTSFVCDERDAARNIGCLVGNNPCSTGVAPRAQALDAANDPINVALRLDGKGGYSVSDSGFTTYPMSHRLWLNAIGGFKNLSTHCANDVTNEAMDYCQHQVDLVNWFRDPANAAPTCLVNHSLPIYAPGTTTPTVECVGSDNVWPSCGSNINQSWSSSTFPSSTACLAN